MIINESLIDKTITVNKSKGLKIVFTNGCFDILSRTHVDYLHWCKSQGDKLVVAINDDESIKQLKGNDRPWVNLHDRMTILSAIRYVDYVIPFSGLRCTNVINAVKPHIYVKGGDYTIHKLNMDEVTAILNIGAEIKFAPNPDPVTTTDLITKIKNSMTANIS